MTPQETIARLQSQLDECRKERDEARERLEQAERTNQLHWLHEYEKVNEVFAKVMVTLGTTETALAASQSALDEAKRDGERGALWAAHLSLHLDGVKRSVEAFVRGVQLATWKTNEPRVIGFKFEFDAMVSKIAEKDPELPPRTP
jgi:chromosome segregation ATPase